MSKGGRVRVRVRGAGLLGPRYFWIFLDTGDLQHGAETRASERAVEGQERIFSFRSLP